MQKKTQMQVDQIDLLKLLRAYLQRWWLIVICCIVVAAGAWFFSTRFITPMYRAGVTVYVNNSRSGERADSITSGEMTASQQLVRTYVNIITSDRVLEKVIETAQLNCTSEDLRKMMTTEQVSNTEVFKVYITHPDPENAAYIANAIADVAPADIADIVEGSSTKIIDYAKVPKEQFSPNIRKNTMVGGVIGIALSLFFLTVASLFDVRIKEEEDLKTIANYPLLGSIPDFTQLGNSRSGYYGYRTNDHEKRKKQKPTNKAEVKEK